MITIQQRPGPRLNDALAVEVMRAAGYEPLDPYPGSSAPWRCLCLNCGRERTPWLKTVRKGSRCPCHRRPPEAEAAEVLRGAGYEPLERYPGSRVPWRCRCLCCGEERAVLYGEARKGVRCPCQRRGAAAAVMRAAGYEPLVPYPGSGAPWLCRCITCDQERSPWYASVRRGARCPCHRSTDAAAIMRVAGFEPLAPFPGTRSPWHCRCVHCGQEYTPTLHDVRGGVRCPCRPRPLPAAGCHTTAPTNSAATTGIPLLATREQAVADMRHAGYEPLKPYPGPSFPWRARCTSCGEHRAPRLISVRRGARCPCHLWLNTPARPAPAPAKKESSLR